MQFSYEEAERAFKNDKIRELSFDTQGMRFLKLRSLSRKAHLNRLIDEHHLQIPQEISTSQKLQQIFESNLTDAQMDDTIRAVYAEERSQRAKGECDLIDELYKMVMFDWGGLHQNNLEKAIIDH